MRRNIIHLDMDAFYASVEQRDFPELKEKPVIVGGNSERGVVCSCSYEARKYGVRSAMGILKAKRLCPQGIVMPVRMDKYKEASERVFSIFHRYTDLVEPLSVDEAFLDVTGSKTLFGSPRQIAERVREEVLRETGLVVSAGIASNKFLAKLASESAKPDGIYELEEEQVESFLLPMDVSRIWGVGPVLAEKMRSCGIQTVRALRELSEKEIGQRWGRAAESLYALSRGIDDRPVVVGSGLKSIGNEETFAQDIWDQKELGLELLRLCEKVGYRIRKKGLLGETLTIKVKYADFTRVSRSRTIPEGLDGDMEIYREGSALLKKTDAGKRAIRLLGVSLSGLMEKGKGQVALFCDEQKDKSNDLNKAIDEIRSVFGEKGLKRGSLLKGKSRGGINRGEN